MLAQEPQESTESFLLASVGFEAESTRGRLEGMGWGMFHISKLEGLGH